MPEINLILCPKLLDFTRSIFSTQAEKFGLWCLFLTVLLWKRNSKLHKAIVLSLAVN